MYVYTDVVNNSYPHVQMNITQSMEITLVDSFSMCLLCMASVTNYNLTYDVIMRWSGAELQQSLWVNQLPVVMYKNCIVRKLCFVPWLGSHAGGYTCHVDVKNDHKFEFTVNKTFTVNGKQVIAVRSVYIVE